jgi:formylmethanofuran dehydrogenase subunit D
VGCGVVHVLCKKEEIQRIYLLSGFLAENKLSKEDAMKLILDISECSYVYINPQDIVFVTSKRFNGGYEVQIVTRFGKTIVFDVYSDEIVTII